MPAATAAMLERRREILAEGAERDRLEGRLQRARRPGEARHRRRRWPASCPPRAWWPTEPPSRWPDGPRSWSRRWRWSSAATAARSSRCCPRSRWPTRRTSPGTSSGSWPGTSSTAPWRSARAWRPRRRATALVLVNGEEHARVPAERTAAHLEAMVAAVGDRLAGRRRAPPVRRPHHHRRDLPSADGGTRRRGAARARGAGRRRAVVLLAVSARPGGTRGRRARSRTRGRVRPRRTTRGSAPGPRASATARCGRAGSDSRRFGLQKSPYTYFPYSPRPRARSRIT